MLLRKVENPKLIYNKKAAEVQDNPIWVALLEQCTINFTWQNLSEKLTLIFLSPRVVTCHLNMLCNMQKAGIKDRSMVHWGRPAISRKSFVPVVEDTALWDWFVHTRAAVKAGISRRYSNRKPLNCIENVKSKI